MSEIAIPAWARKRAQDFLEVNDPRDGVAHGNLAAWIVSAVAGYMALHEDEPADWQSEGFATATGAKNAQVADDWQPCERTIKLCIEALPADSYTVNAADHFAVGRERCARAARKALEALLPKPDPAAALIEEWKQSKMANESGPSNPDDWADVGNFTRWLINTERLHP